MLNIIIVICSVIGSVFAGIGTGLIGLSAATAIVPLLVVAGVDAHQAIAIALLSDVCASIITSLVYKNNNHLVHNNGKTKVAITWWISLWSIIFTIVGALISAKLSVTNLGWFSRALSAFVGIKFILESIINKPKNIHSDLKMLRSDKKYFLATILGGAIIGLTSGFAGVGGGLTMLLVFSFFGYKLKDAVCSSTMVMIFVALVGGIAHLNLGCINYQLLLMCVCITSIVAYYTSKIANKANDRFHKLFCGIMLLVSLAIGILIKILGL